MAFELPITILVVFLALHKCLVCENELPPSSFTNIYSMEAKFKESSLEINQPNTAHIFAYSRLVSRNRHGRAAAPVLRTNSMGRIIQLLLMIACDCSSMNPGPAKHPCGVCEQPCKSNQKAIQCDECFYWFHTKCISMTAQSYDRLGSDSKLAWLCTKCIFPNFSTTFLLGEMDASHENTFDSLSSEESTTESLLGPPLFTSSPSNPPARPRPRNQDLRRKLKVLSLNCNGIKRRKKKSEFHSLIGLHDPDIIFGCESKIDPSVPTYSVFPDNYEIFRKDRTLYGGGVFTAVRKGLAVTEERGLDVDDCEIITCTLQLVKRKKLFLTSFYRPPSTDQDALNLLDDHLCKLYSKNIQFPNVIMGGDFNCSGIEWSTGEPVLVSSAHSWDRTLIDLADKFGFSQHVKAPTRKNNYLDLVFSSNPGLIQACHVTSGLSDHERGVLFEIDTSPKYTPKVPRKIYQYHKANFEGLRSHLSTFGAGYTSCSSRRSVDENWSALSECLADAMDRFIPHKMSKTKRHLPWVSPAIKRLMRKRDRAYKKAQRSGSEKDLCSYRRLRNYTTKCIRDTHDKYVSEVMGGLVSEPGPSNFSGTKRAWSYLKLLRSESLGIPTLFQGDKICGSDLSKAEALRAQYDSVFTREDFTTIPVLGDSPYEDIADLTFTSNGVLKQLKSIQPSKAPGPDSVPARILTEAANELAPLLASLFQQSYNSGSFPAAWKDANITAIFKKGHRADPANYRPVSLTSLVSKIMEHIVCKHVTSHLCNNHIISHLQHGFQQGLSCETQLVSAIHDWASVLNAHGQVDVVFLDFAKAFDSVPHYRLLLKAEHYGIRGKLLAWLEGFLTDRRQRVVVNGSCSEWSPVISGVPQGTVIGPVLFLLFINDLPAGLKSHVKLFADDSVLYCPINAPDDHAILQDDLRLLERWAEKWQMAFAPKKCYLMSITLKRYPSPGVYSLCGSILESVTFQKYLGVYITSSLRWDKQAEEVKKKANRVLCILQRNLSSCPTSIKERAYTSLVRPILEYGSVAWSPHTKKDINAVESTQRRAARFATGDYQRSSSVTDMLSNLGWQSLKHRRTVQDLSFFYKVNFGLVKISFPSDVLPKPIPYSTRASVRNNYQFSLLPAKINAFQFSFYPRTIPVWNSLPQLVFPQIPSASIFVAALPSELTR